MNYQNPRALLLYKMQSRQKQWLESTGKANPLMNAAMARADKDNHLQITEYKIYIGLNDAQTRKQECDTQEYLQLLKATCRKYHAAFSVDIEEGGYYHEDGEYTEENSLILSLIDVEKSVVDSIAKDVCARFHQESVLITENQINASFVKSS